MNQATIKRKEELLHRTFYSCLCLLNKTVSDWMAAVAEAVAAVVEAVAAVVETDVTAVAG